MSRTADSVSLEIEYWRGVLSEVDALNDNVLVAAMATSPIKVDMTFAPDRIREKVGGSVERALAALIEVQGALNRVNELANGRVLALRRELEEREDD